MADPYKCYEMSQEVKDIEQRYWSGSKSIRDIERSQGREKAFTVKMVQMQMELLVLYANGMNEGTYRRAARTMAWLERVACGDARYGR